MLGRLHLRRIGCGLCGLIWLTAVGPARAVDRHWNTGTGSWGISSNWSPAGVPTSSDIAYVDFLVGGTRGVAIVTGTGHASPISVSVTNLNAVSIAGIGVNSGSLSVGGDFIVGTNSNVGFLDVNSSSPGIVFYQGRLTVGNALRLGMFSGSGIVNQNDGIVTVNQLLRVVDRHATSRIFPGTGRYNLSGVGVLNAARLEVGYGGDSGQFACEGEFNLSGNATLNVHPGAQVPDPKIGGGGASGVFNQTGGTFRSEFRIIDFAPGGGSGVYNYSGGTFSVPGIHFSNTSGTFNYLNGANLSVGQLQMTGGGNMLLSPGRNKTLRSTVLWVASNSAVIDLNDNAMVTLSVLEQLGGQSLRTLLTRGYNGGAWNGGGIRSSAAAADPMHKTALGYAVASDVLTPIGGVYEFNGQTVPGTASLTKYTYYGDANLDGMVDTADLGRLASAWQTSGQWPDGDFDYSGFVDIRDLYLLANNWQAGVAPSAAMSLQDAMASVGLGTVAVPEPVGSAAALLAVWLTVHRIRPAHRHCKRRATAAIMQACLRRTSNCWLSRSSTTPLCCWR